MAEETDLIEFERIYWSRGIVRIAGIDEAGRGPLAGPVVAAAVMFDPFVVVPDVDDSKKLNEKMREELYHAIYRKAAAVGVGIVSHEVIDRINILQASLLAMNKALDALKAEPQQLLVDGNFFRHETIPFENVVGGDGLSHSIAAASIVAKVTRDALMREYDQQFPEYGFARHKGYGTYAHLTAIRQHGFCAIHRRSFHPKLLERSLAPL